MNLILMRFRKDLGGCKSVMIALVVLMFQHVEAQQFSARLDAGVTSSQISGDGANGFVQFGVIAGGEVGLSFNDTWSSSFGIRFNQKGSRIYKTKNSINTYRLRVNYIEAPLLLQYSLDKLSFAAGPVLGVKINQKERTQFGTVEDPRQFDSFELGLEINIGYNLKERMYLKLLYQNSVLAVRDHPIDQAYPPANFVLGSLHQKILDQGQYFSSLSLVLSYEF